MGWFVSDERVPVELAECRCPDTPHDHDTVWLRAELGPDGGYAVLRAIRAHGGSDELTEALGRAYAEHGIIDWTFLDDDGEPVPVTKQNIRQLSWAAVYPVAERGDTLYAEELLAPLRDRLPKSSPSGRTGRSTSPKKSSTSTRPKRSRPSTTATTQPSRPRLVSSDGDSSTLPKKKSASA